MVQSTVFACVIFGVETVVSCLCFPSVDTELRFTDAYQRYQRKGSICMPGFTYSLGKYHLEYWLGCFSVLGMEFRS